MPRCLVSFGANLGDPRATIEQAQQRLHEGTQASSFRVSRLYNTPPVGGPVGQPPFLNRVVALETDQTPWEIWQTVREVEANLGRERFRRWEARRIDVDILLYDDQRIWTPQLKIPHPRLCMRRFILEPAAEVAGDWREPVSGVTIGSLAERLRRGRANLVLCGAGDDRPAWLLEQVARQAVAHWERLDGGETYTAGQFAEPTTIEVYRRRQPELASRWVAAVECLPLMDQPPLAIQPPPKLVVCYAADDTAARGGQWEDAQRQLAIRLNLIPAPAVRSSVLDSDVSLPLLHEQGARYLLATDDPQWAVHELVAALDAMDCPVEPLAD